MGLGDKAAALALVERDKVVNPTEKDAMYGPFSTELLARIEARLGEPDRAIAALNELLSIPYRGPLVWVRPITPALLRLDPMFDALRNDPHFRNYRSGSSRNSGKLKAIRGLLPMRSPIYGFFRIAIISVWIGWPVTSMSLSET
jgi:hypothetical protein